MFESLTENLKDAVGSIARGRLTEANIREGVQKVRQALLEADVNYDVAKQFTDAVAEQAVGDRVLKSVKPADQIIGIVHEQLVALMGPTNFEIPLRRGELTILMMTGLQGAGKTTTCGKLANRLKKEGHNVMMVAADLQRPAAIEQLQTLGTQIDVPVHAGEPGGDPVQVCLEGRRQAKKAGCDVLILDTAGRLHIDDTLMKQLERIDNKISPHQVYFVCDAMTGQDAVNSARSFNEALELDGVILTKLDGDTRGGAALSIRSVTGVPIKFIGTGETLDGLDTFEPERMAGRILGMGDVVGLVRQAQESLDADVMADTQKRMLDGNFTLDDFLKSMDQIKKLGSMKSIMKLIPGMGQLSQMMDSLDGMDPDKDVRKQRAIIESMTQEERRKPDVIDRSRRHRIAAGSGVDPSEVSELIKQFRSMGGLMKNMAGMGMKERMGAIKDLGDAGAFNPGAQFADKKVRSKRGGVQTKDDLREKKRKERQRKKKNRKR